MSGFLERKTLPSTSHHKKGARSVRKHKLNLNMHGKDGDSKNVGKSKDKDSTLDVEFRGIRVIVFVIGGMTYSEMRCMHKVLFDIDIHIFTVIKFLYNLVVKFKYIFAAINTILTSEHLISLTFIPLLRMVDIIVSDKRIK